MKNVLITGCSTGIGRATALHLGRAGYRVFAGVVSLQDADALSLAVVVEEEGLPVDLVHLDVTQAGMCETVVADLEEQGGGMDVLVNNAGIGDGGPLEFVSEERVRAMFEVNFFGPMRLMRLVTKAMRQQRSGWIVNISSVMGRLARAGGSAYAASKHALEAASEALAQELRRFGVRVILIEPGVVKTPLHDSRRQPPDPESPYAEFDQRGARLFGALLQNPTMPDMVASVIQQAIEDDTPALRYLVGRDAEKWIAGRQAMSDQDWIDLGNPMTIEAYAAYYRRYFEMEI